MYKFFSFILICFLMVSGKIAKAEPHSNVNWFHCPHADEIKRVEGQTGLEAVTTVNGVTIKWRGWLQSQNLPTQFMHVYLEGMQVPWFITCYYKDGFDNYGTMSPLYAEYKSDGKTSGDWKNNLCRSNDPRACSFSVIKST